MNYDDAHFVSLGIWGDTWYEFCEVRKWIEANFDSEEYELTSQGISFVKAEDATHFRLMWVL